MDWDKTSRRKRQRPYSVLDNGYSDEPSTAVMSDAVQFRKAWQKLQEDVKKGNSALGMFDSDRAYLQTIIPEMANGKIISLGRKSPAWPQGAISRSVKQYPDAFETRDGRMPENSRVVPLGTEYCFNIQPGYIAFEIKGMRYQAFRTAQGDTTIVVTTCVNGMGADDETIFCGITRTINSVTGGDGQDGRSAIHVAGLETTILQSWASVQAFTPLIMVPSPFMVKASNGSDRPVPAITVPGQPEDMFVPALIELDERNVSIAQLRHRKEVHKNARFAALFEAKANPTDTSYDLLIPLCLPEIKTMVNNKLKGFEAFPKACPGAAYIYWYCVRQLLTAIVGTGGRLDVSRTGVGALLLDKQFTKFFLTRDDEMMMESVEGKLDTRADGPIKFMCEQVSANSRFDIMKDGGLLEFVDKQLDGVTHSWNRFIRQNYVGKALNWCNPGGELDVLVGYGGI